MCCRDLAETANNNGYLNLIVCANSLLLINIYCFHKDPNGPRLALVVRYDHEHINI